jgi:excisionase family DNA binding protein
MQIQLITTQEGLEQAINAALVKSLEQFNLPVRESYEQPVTQAEICKYLNITEPTLIRWKKKGTIPFLKVGSRVLYEKGKVVEAIRINQIRRVV